MARVLVVDNDPIVLDSLAEFLRAEGHEAATAQGAAEAKHALAGAEAEGRAFDVMVSDVCMPGESGVDLLRHARRVHPGLAVVMLTGYGSIESAVEALRLGACDYLTKPIIDEELRGSLERALRERELRKENQTLRAQLEKAGRLDGIIGQDHRMQKVYRLIEAVAPSRTTVLMCGESGVGKSLVARAIHQRSGRREGPYIELSCGSIPETLLESELFGHVKGAFTGAHADKVGKFLAADGGTIFLDEINSASAGMQLKLLRVLQERRFEPVGSTQTREVDVRVVLASNQPLEALVAKGEFRQDLYYRINVVKIELPPLRERIGDVPLLAEAFLERKAEELGKQLVGIHEAAIEALRRYSFPGNVRELENIIERAAVLTRGQTIAVEDLPAHVVEGDDRGLLSGREPAGVIGPESGEVLPLVEALKDPERRIILRALEACGWNRTKAAERLEINRTTLYKKMRQLGIEERSARRAG